MRSKRMRQAAGAVLVAPVGALDRSKDAEPVTALERGAADPIERATNRHHPSWKRGVTVEVVGVPDAVAPGVVADDDADRLDPAAPVHDGDTGEPGDHAEEASAGQASAVRAAAGALAAALGVSPARESVRVTGGGWPVSSARSHVLRASPQA